MDVGVIVLVVAVVVIGGALIILKSRQSMAFGQTPESPTIGQRETKPAVVAQSAAAENPDALNPGITATLEIVSGPDAYLGGVNIGKSIVLRQKRTTIGRNPRQADIQLYQLDAPSTISRLHCALEYYQSIRCFMLTDEGSSSGTKLDGQPVAPYQPVALRDGDVIELGQSENQGAVLHFHSNINPPDDAELQGGRLRLHMGFDPKETIRQVLKNHQAAAIPDCDVFLSYSRRDRDAMHYLRESLTVSGFTVWSDEKLEPGSQSWRTMVEAAIEKAGCVVALLSPDAKQSEWVGEELNYGKIHGKRIFTVLLRGDESNAIPLGLTGVQWIDMRAGYEEALEQLLRTLRDYLGQES